jgi:hypothetical protein
MKPVNLSDHWTDEAHIVFKWYPSLLTRSETEASKNLILEGKASAAKSSKTSTLLRTAKSKEKETIEELKDGPQAFLKKTFLRVVAEHGKDLSRCPRCRLVCSPGAIVCDHCYLLLKK